MRSKNVLKHHVWITAPPWTSSPLCAPCGRANEWTFSKLTDEAPVKICGCLPHISSSLGDDSGLVAGVHERDLQFTHCFFEVLKPMRGSSYTITFSFTPLISNLSQLLYHWVKGREGNDAAVGPCDSCAEHASSGQWNHVTTLWELALPKSKIQGKPHLSEQSYLCGLWLLFKTLMIMFTVPSCSPTSSRCSVLDLVTANSFNTSCKCSLTNVKNDTRLQGLLWQCRRCEYWRKPNDVVSVSTAKCELSMLFLLHPINLWTKTLKEENSLHGLLGSWLHQKDDRLKFTYNESFH